jgi:hypothetical protein
MFVLVCKIWAKGKKMLLSKNVNLIFPSFLQNHPIEQRLRKHAYFFFANNLMTLMTVALNAIQ